MIFGERTARPTSTPGTRWARRTSAAVLILVAVTGAGCSTKRDTQQSPEPSQASASSGIVERGAVACPDDRQGVILDKHPSIEPSIHVPLTPGWILNRGYGPDQPTLRGLIGNDVIRENDFSPRIQVTLNRYTDPGTSLQEQADGLMEGLGGAPTLGQHSNAEVCGSPVFRTDFTAQKDGRTMSGTQLVSFSDVTEGGRWAAMAVLLTSNPDNPGYVAQRDAMIKGFHLSIP